MIIAIKGLTQCIALIGLLYIMAETQLKFENSECSDTYALIVHLWVMCVVALFVIVSKGY